MKVLRKSIWTGIPRERDLPITPDELIRWKRDNLSVQDAFPNLSQSDREFLVSGMIDEEFEAMARAADERGCNAN